MDRSFYAWTEVFMHRKLHPLRNRDVSWLRSGEKSQNRTLVYNEEIKNPYAGKEQFDWFRQNFLEYFFNYVNRVILRHKFLSHSVLCVLHSYRKKENYEGLQNTHLKQASGLRKKSLYFYFCLFVSFTLKYRSIGIFRVDILQANYIKNLCKIKKGFIKVSKQSIPLQGKQNILVN